MQRECARPVRPYLSVIPEKIHGPGGDSSGKKPIANSAFSSASLIPGCGGAVERGFVTQFNWHIWGADLYENSSSLKFRLFYPLRRLAQGRVGRVFATGAISAGLLAVIRACPANYSIFRRAWIRRSIRWPVAHHAETLTILVGNSGDRSNEHIAALRAVPSAIWRYGKRDRADGDIRKTIRTILTRSVKRALRYLAPRTCRFSVRSWRFLII